ncbi:S8 family serine peptidase [Archangium violaceum]|uniref:S8 family serine peptidase n=1 Tax=Archangium violaceum TaxID=83451 RepID=UPI00193C82D2|nr:S8 family serine peptidase [Archangium violaceum]QRK06355.1 S8 family serine peptidase [Archangium violaceum]
MTILKSRLSSRLPKALMLASCLGLTACPSTPPKEPDPPDTSKIVRPDDAIEGQYLFLFDEAAVTPDKARATAEELLAQHGGSLLDVYESSLVGFSANGLDDLKALAIASDSRVKTVGQDGRIKLESVQDSATWGLDRIDTRTRALDQRYVQSTTGKGVHVYVIDTGIRTSHVDFAGRIGNGATAINDGRGAEDCGGHGTHVAGTIGGSTWGVAKDVILHPVRVLDCEGSGSLGGVIAGIDWVTRSRQKPAVANMSLGGGAHPFIDDAVRKSIAAGVTYVVAAGNNDGDACQKSPARTPEALTVGATSIEDKRAWFSNWGSCVDLFAPGQDIKSTWYTANDATHTISGTSMAAPHVAGVAALFLEKNPSATPAAVTKALLDGSTPDAVQDVKGSPNRLLYSLVIPLQGDWSEVAALPDGATIKQLSVGSANAIWALATNGNHYKWNGSAWDHQRCCVTEISGAADGTLWATNPPDDMRVLRWADTEWDAFSIPSGMKQVSVVNANTVWGLDNEGWLFQWNESAWNWDKKVCCVAQISAGSDGVLWATNPADSLRVLKWNGTEWAYDIPTGMTYVSVGSAAHIWALDGSGNVYKWSGSAWTQMPGMLKQISAASDGTVWGITVNDGIIRFITP